MSVYSVITLTQLEQFLTQYSLGEVIHFEGIQEGVENTNYRVTTTTGTVILTIFESLNKADLSHILQLLQYLKEHSLCCPSPFLDKSANTLLALNTKQAAIFNWILGGIVVNPSVKHCYEVGLQLGKLHQLTQDYTSRGHRCGFCKKLKLWIQKRFHLILISRFHLVETIVNSFLKFRKCFVKLIIKTFLFSELPQTFNQI